MRRLAGILAVCVVTGGLFLSSAACKHKKWGGDDSPAGLATMVHTADPRTAPQLVNGFHAIEQNAWRWTTGHFVVALKPPAGAAQKGAVLHFRFVIPDIILQRLGTIQVSAKVNGTALPPQSYSTTGEQVYSEDVPPSALAGDKVTVEFALDKSLPPGTEGQDIRELGVIANVIGFEAKP